MDYSNPYMQGNGGDSELGQLEKIRTTGGGLNPSQQDQYNKLSGQAGLNPGESFGDYLTRKQTEQANKIVQPAVDSLNAGIPELEKAYKDQQSQQQAEKDPLIARYDQLLNEIRGRETSQVNDTTKTVNRELGRRGIALSSTFADQEVQGQTAGIHSQAQSDILSTNFDRESKLRDIDNTIVNLNDQMVSAERDIRNTIAQIQATAGTEAANRALQIYQIDQQNRQAELDRAVKQKELDANITASQTPKTQVVTAGGRQLLVNSTTGQIIKDLGTSASGAGTGGGNVIIGGGTSAASTSKANAANYVVSSGNTSSKQNLQYNLGGVSLMGNQPNTLFTNPQNAVSKPSTPLFLSTLKL